MIQYCSIVRRGSGFVGFGRELSSSLAWISNKVVPTVDEAVKDIASGNTIIVGGFGASGTPHAVLQAVQRLGVRELTVVSCDAGKDGWGVGLLLAHRQVRRLVAAFVGFTKEFQRQFLAGEVEAEFTPMGTLAERLRAGGAGIAAFYVPVGVGTLYHRGGLPVKLRSDGSGDAEILSAPKEEREISGRTHVLEYGLRGDFALVKAHRGDRFGNLQYRHTARNFNPCVATAGRVTVAEVEQLVEHLHPNEIHTPGIYVHRVVCPPRYEVEYIHKKVRSSSAAVPHSADVSRISTTEVPPTSPRERIARRAVLEIESGMYVNLGIGLPTLISNHLPPSLDVQLHSENGLLGIGPYPSEAEVDPDLCNAGNETVSFTPSSSLFDSGTSFAMIRSGRIHLTFVGALQVSQEGDLASWMVPGKTVRGMGGAMDLAASGSRVVTLMRHVTHTRGEKRSGGGGGEPKLVPQCTLPLTGQGVVGRVITDMGVFDVLPRHQGLCLVELCSLYSVSQVREATGCPLLVSPELRAMRFITT